MPSNYRPLTGKPKHRHDSRVELAGRILTLFSAAFFTVSLLCSFANPTRTSLRPASWTRPSSSTTSSSTRCNPFTQPGYVDAAHTPTGLATWRTYDPSCPTSSLLPSLLSTLHRSPSDPTSLAPHPSHQADPASLSSELGTILSNRTVLLIGDHKVDRTLVAHFCTLVGRRLEPVDRSHPWGEALHRAAAAATHGTASPSSTEGPDLPLAHYCYLPEYDLVLTSVYALGLDTSPTFQLDPAIPAPYRFETRLDQLWRPYLAALASPHSSSSAAVAALPPPRASAEPDVVIFNSGFWDLARWADEDVASGASVVANLADERLGWWRARSVDALAAVRAAWPSTRIVWRDVHFPIGPAGDVVTLEWFVGSERNISEKKNHPLYHPNRIAQLNNAYRSTLYPAGTDLVKGHLDRSVRLPANVVGLEFANLLHGQDLYQLDPFVPAFNPAASLFAEIVLWNLQQAVETS